MLAIRRDGPAVLEWVMRALWKGELPLGQAFWRHAVLFVAVANLAATGAGLALLAADAPTALVLAVFFLPLPYIVVAVVGVWRSADAYRGPAQRAALARFAVLLWAVFMIAI